MNTQRLLLWTWINGKKLVIWLLWSVISLGLAGYLAFLLLQENSTLFVPGDTSAGHYQIETACAACHNGFAGVPQEACTECHGAELAAVNDSHPAKKFADPRNAAKLALVDARRCVSCHREHRPGMTRDMGVTLAEDFCVYCHRDIAVDRPSHQDLAFDTCRVCHLYHDNTALYEDFLLKHLDEPRTHSKAKVPERNLLERYRRTAHYPLQPLNAADQDAPQGVDFPDISDWEMSSHSQSGVNCLACHGRVDNAPANTGDNPSSLWTDKPGREICAQCHAEENKGFLAGRHGMRLAQGLPAMRTELARQPMASTDRPSLSCVACHPAHRFDTRQAAVEACLGCHNDTHSRAYKGSVHYTLWLAEIEGRGAAGSGVSCATCHLPRQVASDTEAGAFTLVEHNQNLNLRPNQKMIRSVCLHCHGLGFTLDTLVDRMLVNNNFTGDPAKHVQSLDMAKKRLVNQQE